MTREPQRPLLAWLWPDRPPPEPGRPERVSARGIARLALLVPATVALAALAASAVTAAAGGPLALLAAVATATAACSWLLARSWAAGTWVSDAGAVVRRALQPARRVPWAQVSRIDEDRGRVTLVLRDGTRVRTHVSPWGLDYLGRPEARSMAASRIRRSHGAA